MTAAKKNPSPCPPNSPFSSPRVPKASRLASPAKSSPTISANSSKPASTSSAKKKVNLLPDFPTGGIADFSEYDEGLRGGKVRVRARIEQTKRSLFTITEIPHGTTTTSLMDSIIAANEKGKLKIARIEDHTADKVKILVHLASGTDPDAILQALYAFTDCEVSISPNACLIEDDKPKFLSVNEILKHNALHAKDLLQRELEIRLEELSEKWHFSSSRKSLSKSASIATSKNARLGKRSSEPSTTA